MKESKKKHRGSQIFVEFSVLHINQLIPFRFFFVYFSVLVLILSRRVVFYYRVYILEGGKRCNKKKWTENSLSIPLLFVIVTNTPMKSNYSYFQWFPISECVFFILFISLYHFFLFESERKKRRISIKKKSFIHIR